MQCIECKGSVTVFSPGKPHERAHCHGCGAQVFRGLLINRANWERWVNGDDTELKGKPATQ